MTEILAVWLVCFSCGPRGFAAVPKPGGNPSEKELHALFQKEWDYRLEQSPTTASGLGDRRWNDRWEDVSLRAMEQRRSHAESLLVKLQKMDRRKLGAPDQLNYDLFVRETRLDLEEYGKKWFLIPLNQREGIQTADELIDNLHFVFLKGQLEQSDAISVHELCG